MSKLTLHLQSIPGYAANWPSEYVKLVDPPEQNPYPGCKVIARFFMPDGDSNAMVRRGALGAEQWFAWLLPRCRARPWLHAVEGPNEPQPMSDAGFRAALDAFTLRLAHLCNAAGLTLVGHNWGVGWPDQGHARDFAASINALAAGGHYLGLHEYSAPSMRDGGGYLTLRYRRTMAELRAAGIAVPQIVIGECGIDGGVIGNPGQGWQAYTDAGDYFAQLQWYDAELERDPEVEAACIFTCCDWDWNTFHVTEPLAHSLRAYIVQDTEPEPEEHMEPGIDVSEYQGAIDWGAVAASGVKFAMIRASVARSDGSLAQDARFAANWAGAKAAGLPRGAYHYLHQNALGQAKYFADVVGDDRPELGYWADIEDASLDAGKCELFLSTVDGWTGETTGIYTRASYFDKWGSPAWAVNRPLWVAHYADTGPALPQAWTEWDFWQYTSTGRVPGISGNVDLDYYAGSLGPEPEEPEEEPVGVKVVDMHGVEQDWAWVQASYGDVALSSVTGDAYRVAQLTEIEGPMAFTCTVLNSAGGPEVGRQVAYIWPSGESVEITNGSGVAEHTAGAGEGYDPNNGPGPITWQVRGGGTSQTISGLGWLWGTNHRHLNVIFRYGSGDEPPVPPDDEVAEILAAILAEVQAIRDLLTAGWHTVPA